MTMREPLTGSTAEVSSARTTGQPSTAGHRLASGATLAASAGTIMLAAAATLGGVLRLIHLDRAALDSGEAALAAAAHGIDAPGLASPDSPLLMTLTRLSMWMLGADDGVARLIPALSGIALVLLAGALHPYLGRGGAVAASIGFAVAPVWVFFGRHLSEQGLAAAIVVATVAAAAAPTHQRRIALPVAAGLLAAAGPSAMTFLVAVVVGLAATRGAAGAARRWLEDTWPEAADRRIAGALFAGTAVLAATGFLNRPEGFAEVIGTPAAWIVRLTEGGVGAGITLLSVAAYAPTLAAFGVAGIVAGLRRAPTLAGPLAVWAGVAFFVVVVSGRPSLLAELLLPLTLAAAMGGAILASSLAQSFRWAEDGAMASVLVIVVTFASLQSSMFAFQSAPGDDGLFLLALGGFVMAGLLMALYVALWGPRVAARAVGLAAIVLLPVGAWANGAVLLYGAERVMREPLRLNYATPDLRNLVANVESASWNRTRDPHSLAVRVDPSLAPLLAWPLRNQRQLTWGPARGAIDDEIVVRPSGAPAAEGFGPDAYVGATYEPGGHWIPAFRPADATTAGSHAAARAFARWYFHRAGGATLESDLVFDQVDVFLKAEE